MENQKKVYRKAVLSDFITDFNLPKLDKKNFKNNEKIKDYRIQGEFGQKKFIKPWRTSTKSQQLPPKGRAFCQTPKKNKSNN